MELVRSPKAGGRRLALVSGESELRNHAERNHESTPCYLHKKCIDKKYNRVGLIGWACRLPGLGWGPGNQAGRVQEDGPGTGHRSRGSGEGPRGAQTLRFPLYLRPAGQLLSPGERVSSSPSKNSQNLQISLEFHFQNLLKFHYSVASRAVGCEGTLAKPYKTYRPMA